MHYKKTKRRTLRLYSKGLKAQVQSLRIEIRHEILKQEMNIWNHMISPLYQAIHHFSGKGILSGAPDVLLHRLTGFIQEFSSSPILPDFLYELQAELSSKTSKVTE